MKLKELFLKKKRFIIASVITLLIGTSLGVIGAPNQASLDNTIADNKKMLSELEDINKTIIFKQDEVESLSKEKSTLEQSKTQIIEVKKAESDKLAKEKEEQERLVKEKEEQEKIAKEKAEEKRLKDEADKLAREEESKKAQEQSTIANNKNTSKPESKPPTNNNKPSSNTSNGNNVAVDQAKDKIVYRTATGGKYHSHNRCGKSNPSTTTPISVKDAEAAGLGPCNKCF